MPRRGCSKRAWRALAKGYTPTEGEALLSDTVVTAWTQVAPRSNQQANQTLDSGAQAWPNGVNVLQGRLDCTPFSGSANARFDAATKVVDWELGWSFDGGATWLSTGGAELGSPTGVWGKSQAPYPHTELDFSTQAELPTHYRARATPRTTLNFGVSFQTLSRTQ